MAWPPECGANMGRAEEVQFWGSKMVSSLSEPLSLNVSHNTQVSLPSGHETQAPTRAFWLTL